jgi:hypothetical protein
MDATHMLRLDALLTRRWQRVSQQCVLVACLHESQHATLPAGNGVYVAASADASSVAAATANTGYMERPKHSPPAFPSAAVSVLTMMTERMMLASILMRTCKAACWGAPAYPQLPMQLLLQADLGDVAVT